MWICSVKMEDFFDVCVVYTSHSPTTSCVSRLRPPLPRRRPQFAGAFHSFVRSFVGPMRISFSPGVVVRQLDTTKAAAGARSLASLGHAHPAASSSKRPRPDKDPPPFRPLLLLLAVSCILVPSVGIYTCGLCMLTKFLVSVLQTDALRALTDEKLHTVQLMVEQEKRNVEQLRQELANAAKSQVIKV